MRQRSSTDTRRLVPVLLLIIAASGPVAFAADPGAVFEVSAAMDTAALALAAMAAPIASALRRGRGRPRKFAAPSRAVTLTLPESVLEALTAINPDPSQAIVQLARRRTPANGRPPAELAVFGRRAVITIRPTASLEQRTGIHLVPLPDGRALISFDQPKSVAELELLLMDALEDPALLWPGPDGIRGHCRHPQGGTAVGGRHAASSQHHRARVRAGTARQTRDSHRAPGDSHDTRDCTRDDSARTTHHDGHAWPDRVVFPVRHRHLPVRLVDAQRDPASCAVTSRTT